MVISGYVLVEGIVVPWFFKNEKISLGAKCTYGLLAKLSRGKDRCWPSQKYLASVLGVSVRTIQKYLRELAASGYISISYGQDRETNTYQLLAHPVVVAALSRRAATESKTDACPDPSEKIAQGANANTSPVLKKEEEKKSPLTPHRGGMVDRPAPSSKKAWKQEALAAFDRVWAVWPVQEAREAALRWWLRLWRLGILPSINTILSSVRSHIAQNPRWKRGFVPFLVTWLKGHRWKDTFESESKPQPHHFQGNACETGKRKIQKLFYSKEEDKKPLRGRIPRTVWDQLHAAISLWKGQALCETEYSRVRGLWMYLYINGKIPTDENIVNAASSAKCSFARWLHGYQESQQAV